MVVILMVDYLYGGYPYGGLPLWWLSLWWITFMVDYSIFGFCCFFYLFINGTNWISSGAPKHSQKLLCVP